MGNSQEQALGTEKFQQKQALFQKYTAVDGAFKNQVIAAVKPVFLYPLVDNLTGFWTGVHTHHASTPFIKLQENRKNYLGENAVNMMGSYDPTEPLAQLI